MAAFGADRWAGRNHYLTYGIRETWRPVVDDTLRIQVGDAGNNTLSGDGGSDGLFGQDGDDLLLGYAGSDGLSGGNGNDTLDGGLGADRMAGGGGNDTYRVDNAGDVVDESYNSGKDTVESWISFSLQPGAQVLGDIENLTLMGTASIDGAGNALSNEIAGNSGANHLYGLDGNDTLSGAAGNDSLDGGTGNDVLDGGTGADSMVGGTGDDVYVIDDKYGDKVVEAVGGGIDTVLIKTGPGGYALKGWNSANPEGTAGQEVEAAIALKDVNGAMNLHGNALNNLLWGNDWGSVLEGYEGNDILYGAGGSDTLYGGTGNDIYRFDRGCGADLIIENDATAGNRDTLFIDARADQLWFRRSGNDLVIDIMGSQDANGNNPSNKVTIQNHYAGAQYQVERIVSSDGKVLAAANADYIVNALSGLVETFGDTTIWTNMSKNRQMAYYYDVLPQWGADATVSNLIAAMAQMAPPAAGTTLAPSDYQNRVTAIYAANVMA